MAEKFEQENSLSEEDFAHFIGKKADKYLLKFRKFSIDGVDKFSVTWHWPAFFFGLFWMLYRKLYLWALLAFILGIAISSLPYYFALPMMIVWGMTGNYIYYKHAKKKILKLKTDQPSFDLSLMATSLRKIGGVNRWVPYIPVIIFIAGICAAIAIPQFSAYRMRSYNAAALADLTNACTAQEAHFVDNATYCDSIERLTGDYYGLYLSEDVTVYVQSANKDHYLMVAFHEKGNKKYVITGPGGEISEAEKTFSIADLNKAIEINPRDADAYNNRGLAYGRKGQYDQAIADYTKAIEIDPRHAGAYFGRGIAYYNKGQHDQAIADYTKAIEIDPRHAWAYNFRGIAYVGKGQYDQAIADYTKAIEIDPRHAGAYYNRGDAYYNKGQHDQAIADYTKAIEIDPGSAPFYVNRGNAWDNKGNLDRAIADYNKAIEIDPRNAWAYRERGVAYASSGDYEQAIQDYNRVIKIDPSNVRVYRSRGDLFFYQARFALAEKDYKAYLRIKPRDIYSMLWLYIVQERGGKSGLNELSDNIKNVDIAKWPGPVAHLFLEKMSPEELLVETKDDDQRVKKERQCEAYFYLGQYYLLRNDKEKAAQMFKLCLETKVTSFVEYTGAKVELERMSLE